MTEVASHLHLTSFAQPYRSRNVSKPNLTRLRGSFRRLEAFVYTVNLSIRIARMARMVAAISAVDTFVSQACESEEQLQFANTVFGES